jgi:acyl transferase domain-containing protein/acyl carrier protein
MAAVIAEASTVRAMIEPFGEQVSIAALNGPANTVISGRSEAVGAALQLLAKDGVEAHALPVSHAFHSALMEPMLSEFERAARPVAFRRPQLDVISNLTGEIATAEELLSPLAWTRQIREPVRFEDGMKTLARIGCTVFIEIGPHPVLCGMGRQFLDNDSLRWLPSLRRGRGDWEQVLESVAALYERGAEIDWAGFDAPYARQTVDLPTYAFQRKRYWIDRRTAAPSAKLPGKKVLSPLVQDTVYECEWGPVESPLRVTSMLIASALSAAGAGIALENVTIANTSIPNLRTVQTILKSAGNRFEIYSDGGDRGWTLHASGIARDAEPGPLSLPDGETLASAVESALKQSGESQISSLSRVRVRPDGSIELSGLRNWADWVYQLEWRPQAAQPWDLSEVRKWILLGAHNEIGAAVAQRLEELGIEFEYGLDGSLERNCGVIEFSAPGWEPRLLELLHRAGDNLKIPFWVVTSGTQRTSTDKFLPSITQSPVWGFRRGVGLEFPLMDGGAVDLDPAVSDIQNAGMLVDEVLANGPEDQVAFRAGHRFVARLVSVRDSVRNAEPMRLDPTCSYLITGGLGAVGVRVARGLAARGARHLSLVGRSAPSGLAQAAIRTLESEGVHVSVLAADVGDLTAIAALISRYGRDLPELKGVIHAAGLLDSSPIREMEAEDLQRALRAKMEGTLVLHEATRERNLDFFICFSSAASLLGARNRAHYAAANHFLDTFAHYRQTLGLPALTVNWGNWGAWDVNEPLAMDQESSFEDIGVLRMNPDQAMDAMFHALRSGAAQTTIAAFDWPVFLDFYESRRARPLLTEIPARRRGEPEPKDAAVATVWSREELGLRLEQEIRQVLGLDAHEPLDRTRGFFDMGMDSLTSVELRKRLQSALGRDLPSTLAFSYPTVDSLLEFLAPSASAPASPEVPEMQDLLAGLDEAEIEASLRKELEGAGY